MIHPSHPLAEEYPLMGSYDLGRMEEDMRERGFDPRFPVVLFDGQVLDGRNRELAANAAGVDPVYVEFQGDAEQARQFVQRANEERRHLTAEWLQKRRQERIERVAQRRQEGASTRQIAAEEGVSQSQVVADLKTAGEQGCSPEPPDGKVTGRDGKEYPTAGVTPVTPEPESEASDDAPLVDAIGLEVPDELKAAFDPEAERARQKALTLCRQLRDAIHAYAITEAGAQLRTRLTRSGKADDDVRYRSKELISLTNLLDYWAPHASACPTCAARHEGEVQPRCPSCHGTGWTCKDVWTNAPADYRQAAREGRS